MCIICGQGSSDVVKVGNFYVCASARWCLTQRLKQASDLEIAKMHRAALETALSTRVLPHIPRSDRRTLAWEQSRTGVKRSKNGTLATKS